MTARGVILAATQSGSGKTTVTLGLARALRDRGWAVATAKVGPDYIDPTFHAAASGRPCLNLDPWAMRPATLAALIARHADAELVLCEGVMGLFDGIDAAGSGSTAELAALTGWPVVLIADARGMAASVAALMQGFVHPPASLRRAGLRVAGIVCNRVGSAAHARLLREALAAALPEIPVLGCVPRHDTLRAPERHLGLVPARELALLEAFFGAASEIVGTSVDLDALVALTTPTRLTPDTAATPPLPPLGQRIAVAEDDAFRFAYPAVLDGWREAGAALTFFSPLRDEAPASDSDALYLPGGYPELHAGRLAAARTFLDTLRRAAGRGVTIYGECGGYMTLGAGLVDAEGQRHALAGLLPLETSFAARRLHLGYRRVTLKAESPLGKAGSAYRGHEFHYATILDEGPGDSLFDLADSGGRALAAAGRRSGSVAGSFVHLIDRSNL